MGYKYTGSDGSIYDVGFFMNPQLNLPLDSRSVVETAADLQTINKYVGQLVTVTDDTVTSNNGLYIWSGTSWDKVKSSADPLLAEIIKDDTRVYVTDTAEGDGTSQLNFEVDSTNALTVDATSLTLPVAGQNIKFGAVEFVVDTAAYAGSTGTVDLGSNTQEWKDLYLSGDANIGGSINLGVGGTITVNGAPYGAPSITAVLDANISSSIDSDDLDGFSGGTIILNNEDSTTPGQLLPMSLDLTAGTGSVLADTDHFEVYVVNHKALVLTVDEAFEDVISGTTVSSGNAIYIGAGQFLKWWRNNSTNYYIILSA
jgi:hypothetical protein